MGMYWVTPTVEALAGGEKDIKAGNYGTNEIIKKILVVELQYLCVQLQKHR